MLEYNNRKYVPLGINCYSQFQFDMFSNNYSGTIKSTPFDYIVIDILDVITYFKFIKDKTIFDVISDKNNYEIIEISGMPRVKNTKFKHMYYWHVYHINEYIQSPDVFIAKRISSLKNLLRIKKSPCTFIWQNIQFSLLYIAEYELKAYGYTKENLILTKSIKEELESITKEIFPNSNIIFVISEQLKDVEDNNIFVKTDIHYKPWEDDYEFLPDMLYQKHIIK